MIIESKLDESFSSLQFTIGYTLPSRLDRNKDGRGVVIYVRENIPSRVHTSHPKANNLDDFEGIFLEINQSAYCSGFNHKKSNISKFQKPLSHARPSHV